MVQEIKAATVSRSEVEEWYVREMSASGVTAREAASTPFSHKWLAYALVFALPVTLAGCGSSDSAYDECVYEKELYGYEMDCDDDSSSSSRSAASWYHKKGYTSKSSSVSKESAYYKSRSGIGKSSGGLFSGG